MYHLFEMKDHIHHRSWRRTEYAAVISGMSEKYKTNVDSLVRTHVKGKIIDPISHFKDQNVRNWDKEWNLSRWTNNLHLFTYSSNLTKYKHFSFETVPVTGRQLSSIHYNVLDNVPVASTIHRDPSRIIIIINEQYRLDFKAHWNCSLIEGFIYRDLNALIEIIGNTPSLSGQNAFSQ